MRMVVWVFYWSKYVAGVVFGVQVKAGPFGGKIFFPEGGFRMGDGQFFIQKIRGGLREKVGGLVVFSVQVHVQDIRGNFLRGGHGHA